MSAKGSIDPTSEPPVEPAPVLPPPHPTHPHVPGPDEQPGITLEQVQDNQELSLYITSADRVMEAMGYTEHGFRHANLVASIAYQVLHRLGYTEREATLACVAGYLHDVGNALARDAHGQTGAVLVYQALRGDVPGHDLMPVLAAIANHEETEGTAVSADLGGGDPGRQVRRASEPRPQAPARSNTTSTTA